MTWQHQNNDFRMGSKFCILQTAHFVMSMSWRGRGRTPGGTFAAVVFVFCICATLLPKNQVFGSRAANAIKNASLAVHLLEIVLWLDQGLFVAM